MLRTSRLAVIGATTLAVTGLVLSVIAPANASLAPVKKVMKLAPTENRLPPPGGAPVGLSLSYGGGPVEITSRNYAIFWDPASFSYASIINTSSHEIWETTTDPNVGDG